MAVSTNPSAATVDGIDLHIDGPVANANAETIVMIHGWPDTHRLWDSVTDALKDRYRCVRFDLPGYDLVKPPRDTGYRQMTALVNRIVMEVSPSQPVTLMVHDWGCVFGYEYAMQNPLHVKRLIGVDIGDHNTGAWQRSLSLGAKLGAFAYQYWLAWAWRLGPRYPQLANRMTRWMAAALGHRIASETISWQMNYPYAMNWMKALGGFAGLARIKLQWPTLFIYGTHKPFMFHSPQWLKTVAATPGGKTLGIASGHWMMLREPQEFNKAVRDWLDS
jgi:pimeloyl-ACP methyl ester carboxylesterase